MREIPLTKGAVALVDDEDFDRIAAKRWYLTSNGYAARSDYTLGSYARRGVLMHRQIMTPPPGYVVDHIDRNPLNNTRANLRVCTQSQNLRNSAPHRGGCGFKGVWWSRRINRWQAGLMIEGRRIYVGVFASPEAAARAYDRAAMEHHGEFARLNFPQPA